MSQLVSYGIQTEKSTHRAHVSLANECIYIFPTQAARDAIATGKYRLVSVVVDGMTTAKGYIVPFEDIQGGSTTTLDTIGKLTLSHCRPDKKGYFAERALVRSIERGDTSFTASANTIDDYQMQLDGIDIIAGSASIQAKADLRAGPKPKGTGNLFLQIAERNYWGQY